MARTKQGGKNAGKRKAPKEAKKHTGDWRGALVALLPKAKKKKGRGNNQALEIPGPGGYEGWNLKCPCSVDARRAGRMYGGKLYKNCCATEEEKAYRKANPDKPATAAAAGWCGTARDGTSAVWKCGRCGWDNRMSNTTCGGGGSSDGTSYGCGLAKAPLPDKTKGEKKAERRAKAAKKAAKVEAAVGRSFAGGDPTRSQPRILSFLNRRDIVWRPGDLSIPRSTEDGRGLRDDAVDGELDYANEYSLLVRRRLSTILALDDAGDFTASLRRFVTHPDVYLPWGDLGNAAPSLVPLVSHGGRGGEDDPPRRTSHRNRPAPLPAQQRFAENTIFGSPLFYLPCRGLQDHWDLVERRVREILHTLPHGLARGDKRSGGKIPAYRAKEAAAYGGLHGMLGLFSVLRYCPNDIALQLERGVMWHWRFFGASGESFTRPVSVLWAFACMRHRPADALVGRLLDEVVLAAPQWRRLGESDSGGGGGEDGSSSSSSSSSGGGSCGGGDSDGGGMVWEGTLRQSDTRPAWLEKLAPWLWLGYVLTAVAALEYTPSPLLLRLLQQHLATYVEMAADTEENHLREVQRTAHHADEETAGEGKGDADEDALAGYEGSAVLRGPSVETTTPTGEARFKWISKGSAMPTTALLQMLCGVEQLLKRSGSAVAHSCHASASHSSDQRLARWVDVWGEGICDTALAAALRRRVALNAARATGGGEDAQSGDGSDSDAEKMATRPSQASWAARAAFVASSRMSDGGRYDGRVAAAQGMTAESLHNGLLGKNRKPKRRKKLAKLKEELKACTVADELLAKLNDTEAEEGGVDMHDRRCDDALMCAAMRRIVYAAQGTGGGGGAGLTRKRGGGC